MRLSSLNSACTSFVVLVIIECCLKAALSNHLLLVKFCIIFLNFLTARSRAAYDMLVAARSSLMIFSSKHSIVSGIMSDYSSGSHRMQRSSFSPFSPFYRSVFSLSPFYFSLSLYRSLPRSLIFWKTSSLAPAAKLRALSRLVGVGLSRRGFFSAVKIL